MTGYTSCDDRYSEQNAAALKFSSTLMAHLDTAASATLVSVGVKTAYYGASLWSQKVNESLISDAMLISGSFAIVFIYFLMNIKSLVIRYFENPFSLMVN